MADITIQPTAIIATSNVQSIEGTAGETITAGKPCYRDSSDKTIKLTDSNHTSMTALVGVALHGASASQPVKVATSGDMTYTGSSLVAGKIYVCSTNAGAICPVDDLPAPTSSGAYVSIVGVASSTTNLKLNNFASGAFAGS